MKRISTLLFCICAAPLTYAAGTNMSGTAGTLAIPVAIAMDPCVLSNPTASNVNIKASELKDGTGAAIGQLDLTFTGCTVGEKVALTVTATSSKDTVEARLADSVAGLASATTSDVTITDIPTTVTTQTTVHYKIKAVDGKKASEFVGDTTININVDYNYL
ncbi:hypothetical protein ACRQQF_02740 [Citrobacter arsenatis]|uniref:hypothetical protein n=1 Tax=Citrobacter arsenatis TaxID=2546350 RepID=UPI003D7F277F